MVGRGAVAEFSEVRPGVRIFILFLLLIVLTLGGIIWFDYLGLVDAKSMISPVYRLLGFEKRSSVASADDPNLLDRERLAKEQDALALRQQDLDTRSAALAQKEKELNQLGQDLNDRDAALTAREKAFNDQVKAFDNRRVNIAQNATYLTSMPPAKAVAIMGEDAETRTSSTFSGQWSSRPRRRVSTRWFPSGFPCCPRTRRLICSEKWLEKPEADA